MGIKRIAMATMKIVGDMKADTGTSHMYSMATGLRVQNRPVPPVAEYDAWIAEHHPPFRAKKHRVEGRHLRRAVIMRRNGNNWSEIGQATGFSGSVIKHYLTQLPPELHD